MTENNLPAWDLSDLYKGINDPKIETDLSRCKNMAEDFARDYKGKLASLSAEDFAAALKTYEDMSVIGDILGEFAYLNMCTQMKNGEAMAFYASACTVSKSGVPSGRRGERS